jgi:hypothetical protein
MKKRLLSLLTNDIVRSHGMWLDAQDCHLLATYITEGEEAVSRIKVLDELLQEERGENMDLRMNIEAAIKALGNAC